MRSTQGIRLAVVIFLGALIGCFNHFYYLKWSRLGRDAFLSSQSDRYTRLIAHPHTAIVPITAAIIVSLIWFGCYKGLVALLVRMFHIRKASDKA